MPFPHLRIEKILINDLFNNQNKPSTVEAINIKIPVKKIYKIKKNNFNNIKIIKPIINLSFDKIYEFKILSNKLIKENIKISNGKINFYEKSALISSLEDLTIKYLSISQNSKMLISGNFLGKKFNLELQDQEHNNQQFRNIMMKIKKYGPFFQNEHFKSEQRRRKL